MFIDRPNFSAIDWAKDLQLIVWLSNIANRDVLATVLKL